MQGWAGGKGLEMDVTEKEVIAFLEHGFRNINIGKLRLSKDDLGDIAQGLEQFYRDRRNFETLPCDVLLSPATIVSAGCKVGIIDIALEARREWARDRGTTYPKLYAAMQDTPA